MHFGSRSPLQCSTERLHCDLVDKRVACPGLPPAKQPGSLGEMYWLRKHRGELMDWYRPSRWNRVGDNELSMATRASSCSQLGATISPNVGSQVAGKQRCWKWRQVFDFVSSLTSFETLHPPPPTIILTKLVIHRPSLLGPDGFGSLCRGSSWRISGLAQEVGFVFFLVGSLLSIGHECVFRSIETSDGI